MIDEDKFKLMASQRKFCMAPWVHTYVYPDGIVSPCCQARSENITLDSELTPYNCGSLHENSLSEIWNSENYKKIRNDLITQGYSKVCKECYKNEKLGHYSMRNLFNEKFFHHVEKIKETKDDGTFEEVIRKVPVTPSWKRYSILINASKNYTAGQSLKYFYRPLNEYGYWAGAPSGYGQPPRNQFN